MNKDDTYEWSSPLLAGRSPVSIPVEVTAVNLVSNDSLSIDFKILSKIVNPDLTVSSDNVSRYVGISITSNNKDNKWAQ